jgi:hypothetical protein
LLSGPKPSGTTHIKQSVFVPSLWLMSFDPRQLCLRLELKPWVHPILLNMKLSK